MSNITLTASQWVGVQSSLRDAKSLLQHQQADRDHWSRELARHNVTLGESLRRGPRDGPGAPPGGARTEALERDVRVFQKRLSEGRRHTPRPLSPHSACAHHRRHHMHENRQQCAPHAAPHPPRSAAQPCKRSYWRRRRGRGTVQPWSMQADARSKRPRSGARRRCARRPACARSSPGGRPDRCGHR